ncbi:MULTISPECIES: GNAT family N-acetyltransferase [unclassified Actinotalea]|uniref:GNAT family N-acetyltransferase n=1 Tax=unclassified Actinotalea TaxID=2638618 RepID=UPI0015F3B408|nr:MULTISPECIES: GNAT family N-acetyltransferase [unclassified Actinotalea]
MALFRETADVSVRPATTDDEAAIARVQLRAWRATHAATLGEAVLEQLDVMAVRRQWAAAITQPPTRDHHVLVACDGPRVVGFAASVPVAVPPERADAPAAGAVEVVALEVDPDVRRAGHGSRLLAACVDLARDGGATHLQTWVLDGDEGRAQFLGSAGLGPDGAARELGVSADEAATRAVAEHRWVAEI